MSLTVPLFEDTRPLDVICMGRVAVDLYAEQIYSHLKDAQSFRKYLGGCAGNTAVGTARLGLNQPCFPVLVQTKWDYSCGTLWKMKELIRLF